MHEIEFRGKRVDTGEWVYGNFVIMDTCGNGYTGTGIQVQSIKTRMCRPYSVEVDLVTVGQLMHRLPDGTKVFTDDILHIEILDYSTGKVIASGNEVAIYKNCQFGVLWGVNRSHIEHLHTFCPKNVRMRVVGNVFDNPELLEAKP